MPRLNACLFLVLFFLPFVISDDSKCSSHKTYVTSFTEGKIDSLVYAEPDYKVVFALLQSGDLYRSEDGARTFSKVTGIPGTDELFKTPDPKKFYLLAEDGHIYVSTDTGKTFVLRDSTKLFSSPVVHPTNADWILAGSPPCLSSFFCQTTLYVSTDFAQSWKEVKKFVNEPWSWGDAGKYGIPAENVHLMYRESETATSYTYGQSRNLGQKIDYTIPNAIALLHSDMFFFVAQSVAEKLTLYSGPSNSSSLKPCLFPESLPQDRYSILDTSAGSTFINVEHGGSGDRAWGHTYVADSFANPSFTLSLKYNRRQGGKVDFARVKGVQGVYIANQFSGVVGSSVAHDTPLQTYITFNNGGKWVRLAKPKGVDCKDCTGLNLVGRSNRRNIPSFYTTSKAVGLIIASGNVLKTLRDTTPNDLDTYFSRDAGLSWEKIKDGAHHYQFLDHGGIIALVDFVNPTKQYTYSFNEGLNWYDCPINGLDNAIQVTSLSYPPQATHLSFHMIGERSDKTGSTPKGCLVTVDFSDLHSKVCDPVNDYETFSPHDNNKCLLGAKTAYRRRKREKECFNNDAIENNTAIESCPCTNEDWECDLCYQETVDGKCQKIDSPQCRSTETSVADTPPATCNDKYPVRKGYRLVSGTRCNPLADGAVNKYEMKQCPGTGGSSSAAKIGISITVIVILVALVGGFFYRRKTNENFRERTDDYWDRFTGIFRSREGASGYSIAGGRGGEPQDLDDDDYNDKLLSADSGYRNANGNGEKDDFI
eukprot:TRINITY_DN1876_c0_g1_i7.p1 TRINITY_DN1876_c0_g1~~TRINITY_DN1876_c0_g1_i7.p1  ORF type:complete len:764 (-),score=149.30 TRINITY_DN1876_c0_g1_i7:80-2371(-)